MKSECGFVLKFSLIFLLVRLLLLFSMSNESCNFVKLVVHFLVIQNISLLNSYFCVGVRKKC